MARSVFSANEHQLGATAALGAMLATIRPSVGQEDINLIGTPTEIVDKAVAKAGVAHLLGLYLTSSSVDGLVDQMQMFAE